VNAIYPDDRDPAPNAEPGVSAESQVDADAPFVTLEVDGEVFAI
jgi:hypothetical protein